jgi:hypothetical protein
LSFNEGWRYAHVNKDGKPIRKPYQLKKGEISYEMWEENQKKNCKNLE